MRSKIKSAMKKQIPIPKLRLNKCIKYGKIKKENAFLILPDVSERKQQVNGNC